MSAPIGSSPAATRRSPRIGYLLVAVAASSWGTWPLILRYAEGIAPIAPALESVIMMSVLMLVSAPLVLRDRVARKATAGEWGGLVWLGISDALNVLLFFASYQTSSVAITVLTHYLTPIFVALAAPLVLREKQSARTYVAVALAFSGLVLLLRPWAVEGRGNDLLGAAFGAGSAVFYTSNVLVSKGLARAFSGSEQTFYHAAISVPILAAFVPHDAWGTNPHALAVIAVGAIGPGALAGLFFVWGLRTIAASHASTLTLLEPLVAVLVAAVAFHETLGLSALAGAALIVVGAAIVVSKRETPRGLDQG